MKGSFSKADHKLFATFAKHGIGHEFKNLDCPLPNLYFQFEGFQSVPTEL